MARRRFAKAEIIDERLGRAVEVATDMGEFVKQREPEVIDAVISKGQRNDRRAAFNSAQSRAVEIGLRQMGNADEMNAKAGQRVSCPLRPVFMRAQLRKLGKNIRCDRARLIGSRELLLAGSRERLQRQLRASLYRPLISLPKDARAGVVDLIMANVLG